MTGSRYAPFLKWLDEWYAGLKPVNLREIVKDPAGVALFAQDMVNGFCYEGSLASPRVAAIVAPVVDLFQRAYALGVRHLILLQDTHTEHAAEFNQFPPHCIRGTSEAQTVDALRALPFASEYLVFKKNSLHPAFHTDLDPWLDTHQDLRTVILVGDCTDLCTYQTATYLKLRANSRDLPRRVVVPADAVKTPTTCRSRRPRRPVHSLTMVSCCTGSLCTTWLCAVCKWSNILPERGRMTVPDSILTGDTADVYFARTRTILAHQGLDPVVVMEVFPGRAGILCGIQEVLELLRTAAPAAEVEALAEGETMSAREVVLRIRARYSAFGLYETALLGTLASESGWATAAHAIVTAAAPVPVTSFGARHIHPQVAPQMEYAAIVGGCITGATPAGSRRAGREPAGTIPHAHGSDLRRYRARGAGV